MIYTDFKQIVSRWMYSRFRGAYFIGLRSIENFYRAPSGTRSTASLVLSKRIALSILVRLRYKRVLARFASYDLHEFFSLAANKQWFRPVNSIERSLHGKLASLHFSTATYTRGLWSVNLTKKFFLKFSRSKFCMLWSNLVCNLCVNAS